jgi:hypothetical protein
VLDLPSVFNYYLESGYKARLKLTSADDFLRACAEGKFNPKTDLNDAAEIRGKVAESWWFAKARAGGVTLGQIKKDLTVMDTTYDKGMLRLNISAAEMAAANIALHKPTAFDGLMQGWGNDPMWTAAPGSAWGLTRDGMQEGVIKASQLGAFKDRVLILPEPAPKAKNELVKPVVEHFDMEGVDVKMASTPGVLLAKIDAAIAKCDPRVRDLQAQKRGKSGPAAAAIGEEIPRVQGLKGALRLLRDDFAPQVAALEAGTADEQATRNLAVKIAQAMIAAARKWKIKGLDSESDLGFQSMQGLNMDGHAHDSFIYGALVELGKELATPPKPGSPPPSDNIQAKFEHQLATARGAYASACASVTPTTDAPFSFGHDFVVHYERMRSGGSANYIFPATYRSDSDPASTYGYQNFTSWTIEYVCKLSKQIAEGSFPDAKTLCIYLAAMVAEPHRNVVAEVTNRLVMGDSGLQSAQALHDNGQMPMARGGTIRDPADLSLDPLRAGSAKASGQVTDREVAMAKTYYEQATGQDLTAMIEEKGETPATRKLVKDALRSRFSDLNK